jgi:hypothetical protein
VRFDRRLEARNEHGIAIINGDGRETGYHEPHRSRELGVRRVLEDPMFAVSYQNQFVQIAELVAYCAYQHVLSQDGKRFVRDWYSIYLPKAEGPVDV